MRSNKYEYDAFISHAVEDKIPIANELCAKLEREGLKIWYSGKELGIGDSIEKTIEKGLNRSRYGIVIFSPTYLAKNWTIREFYTLLAKEIEEHKVILPVLFNISLDELKNKDLVMADRFAVNADKGVDFVVERLVREIRKSQPAKVKQAWFSGMWCVLILSLFANVGLVLQGTVFSNDRSLPARGPDESFANSSANATTAHHRTLLGEMQGLFNQLNTCACRGEDDKPVRFRQTRLVRNPPSSDEGNFYEEEAPTATVLPKASAGRKVTMAVVLQIDSRPEATPDMEREIDDMLSTISLSGNTDPQLAGGNQDPGRQCSHGHNFGD